MPSTQQHPFFRAACGKKVTRSRPRSKAPPLSVTPSNFLHRTAHTQLRNRLPRRGKPYPCERNLRTRIPDPHQKRRRRKKTGDGGEGDRPRAPPPTPSSSSLGALFSLFSFCSCSCIVKISALRCDSMRWWAARCNAMQLNTKAGRRRAEPSPAGARPSRLGRQRERRRVATKKRNKRHKSHKKHARTHTHTCASSTSNGNQTAVQHVPVRVEPKLELKPKRNRSRNGTAR